MINQLTKSKEMKKIWIGISVIVVVLVIVLIVTQPKKEPEEIKPEVIKPEVIKIGHIAPFTGDAAIWGQWAKEGIDLAVDEINLKGGIKGKKLVVIHEDDHGEPDKAVSAIKKLITVDKVQIIIGGVTSGATLACAPIAEQKRVVLLSHGAAANKISYAGDYVFRIFPSNAQQAERLIEIAQRLKIMKASNLFINNDYGAELAEVVKKRFEESGGTILSSEGYEAEATDFKTQLTKIKDTAPQAIFLLGYPKDMALVLKQAKEMGINVQFLAPDTFDTPEILEWSGGAAEGVIYVYPALLQTDRLEKFAEVLKKKFQKEPNVMNTMGYDAIRLLAEAIEKGGYEGTQIKKALYELRDFPGVTGEITFDKNGDVIHRPLGIRIVKDGKFMEYEIK